MPIQLSPNKTASISGTVDVKLNNTNAWNAVKINILISKGKLFTIHLDNNATGNHFQGQPIYGVVESIKDAKGNELLKAQQQAMQQSKRCKWQCNLKSTIASNSSIIAQRCIH